MGKDSSVLVRLWQKVFAPRRIPFPFLHVDRSTGRHADTSFKFEAVYEFRDDLADGSLGVRKDDDCLRPREGACGSGASCLCDRSAGSPRSRG